jgi:hypothetical protein
VHLHYRYTLEIFFVTGDKAHVKVAAKDYDENCQSDITLN